MERKGLGRGLAALLSEAMAGEDAAFIRGVPLNQIHANPYQPRQDFDSDRLSELADSVRTHGVLQPVLLKRVTMDSYELIAGERRVRAAQQAGLTEIPAIVRE